MYSHTDELPNDFNWKQYVENYLDLQIAGIDSEEKAIKHWKEHGKNENRFFASNSKIMSPSVKINIIYFAFLVPGRWEILLINQLKRLSLLKDLCSHSKIYVNLSGSKTEISKATNTINELFSNMEIYSTDTKNKFEYIGINCLWEIANKEPGSYCLYFHTKGISRSSYHPIEIVLFERIIKPYNKIINLFEENKSIDKIGLLSQGSFVWYNFFWARASYIIQCEKPVINTNRFYYESWLATGPNSPCYQLYFNGQHSYVTGPEKHVANIFELIKNGLIGNKLYLPKLETDFDWKQYIDNYADLRAVGIDSEEKAVKHWLDFGRFEGRVYSHSLSSLRSPKK